VGRRLRILKHPRVPEDIEEIASFIAAGDLDAALRFIDAVESTFERLSERPFIGFSRPTRNPAFAGLRIWPVQGYPNHLVFYIPGEDVVEVIRILHGAQDWCRIFETDSDR
jgi:toxin ParE1/3/4